MSLAETLSQHPIEASDITFMSRSQCQSIRESMISELEDSTNEVLWAMITSLKPDRIFFPQRQDAYSLEERIWARLKEEGLAQSWDHIDGNIANHPSGPLVRHISELNSFASGPIITDETDSADCSGTHSSSLHRTTIYAKYNSLNVLHDLTRDAEQILTSHSTVLASGSQTLSTLAHELNHEHMNGYRLSARERGPFGDFDNLEFPIQYDQETYDKYKDITGLRLMIRIIHDTLDYKGINEILEEFNIEDERELIDDTRGILWTISTLGVTTEEIVRLFISHFLDRIPYIETSNENPTSRQKISPEQAESICDLNFVKNVFTEIQDSFRVRTAIIDSNRLYTSKWGQFLSEIVCSLASCETGTILSSPGHITNKIGYSGKHYRYTRPIYARERDRNRALHLERLSKALSILGIPSPLLAYYLRNQIAGEVDSGGTISYRFCEKILRELLEDKLTVMEATGNPHFDQLLAQDIQDPNTLEEILNYLNIIFEAQTKINFYRMRQIFFQETLNYYKEHLNGRQQYSVMADHFIFEDPTFPFETKRFIVTSPILASQKRYATIELTNRDSECTIDLWINEADKMRDIPGKRGKRGKRATPFQLSEEEEYALFGLITESLQESHEIDLWQIAQQIDLDSTISTKLVEKLILYLKSRDFN